MQPMQSPITPSMNARPDSALHRGMKIMQIGTIVVLTSSMWFALILKKQHLHAKDMQWLKWAGGQGLGPQFWFENPCSSMSPFMESELRLFRACAVYSTWRHTTVLMWRLTGGRPPLQRSTLSNRLAVLACVRCEGGPLLLNFRPMLLSSVWREIGSCLQYFFLSLFFYI